MTLSAKYHRIISYIAILLYITAIFTLCLFNFSGKGMSLPPYFLGVPADKAMHFAMFLPFFPVMYVFLPKRTVVVTDIKACLPIIAAGAAVAFLSELSQYLFTESRNAELLDFAADISGLLAGGMLTLITASALHKITKKTIRETDNKDRTL